MVVARDGRIEVLLVDVRLVVAQAHERADGLRRLAEVILAAHRDRLLLELAARADARYLKGDAEANVAGAPAGEVQLDPWVVGVGVGTRF